MADSAGDDGGLRFGTYVGKASDYTAPGDHVTIEIQLLADLLCIISCCSELSPSKGGSNAWSVEGTYEYEDGDDEMFFNATKEDPLGGPKSEREVKILVSDNSLTFKVIECIWDRPPPDIFEEELVTLGLKYLKAAALAAGLDPAGCLERGDFETLLRRARKNGTLKSSLGLLKDGPESPPTSPKAEASPTTSPVSSPVKAKASSPAASSPAASSPAVASPTAAPAVEAPAAAAPAAAASAAVTAAAVAPAAAAPAASAAATTASVAAESPAVPAQEAAAEQAPKEGEYTLEQLTDKRTWEKLDIKATERETYLPEGVFNSLFGMPKADFAKQPKWKKDNVKKKHGLF